jgi:hypothetical protein
VKFALAMRIPDMMLEEKVHRKIEIDSSLRMSEFYGHKLCDVTLTSSSNHAEVVES